MKARKKLTIVLAGAVAALAVGSLAFAAIPDVNGVIHGCYDKQSGLMRVTDTDTNTLSSLRLRSLTLRPAG